MNIIKAKTRDGKTVLLRCDQRKPDSYSYFWNSPALVKARAVAAGLTLTGKRQR